MNCNPEAGDGHYFCKQNGKWICIKCGATG